MWKTAALLVLSKQMEATFRRGEGRMIRLEDRLITAQNCNDPPEPAQPMPLERMLPRASSCPTPDEGAWHCKNPTQSPITRLACCRVSKPMSMYTLFP